MDRLGRSVVLAGLAVSLAGCGALHRNPVPPELTAIGDDPGHAGGARVGRRPEPHDGTRSGAVLRPGIPHGLSPRPRRPRSLSAPRGVRRGRERRLRRRIPERLDGDRHSSGLQDRHRRFDRRADRAVRLSRPEVRRRAPRVLHDDFHARHLRPRLLPAPAAAGRGAGRHRPARGADRAARRRGIPGEDRRRARARPAAVRRHGGPRLPAVRRLEHGADRQKRSSRGAGSLPQGHARVRVHPGRLSAGVLRGRGRRTALRRDARRRRRGIQRLREWRGVPFLARPRRRRTRRGAGRHLSDPQRQAARRAESDAAIPARHRDAGPGGFAQGIDGRRPLSRIRLGAARGGDLPMGHDRRGRRAPGGRNVRPGEDERALRDRLPGSRAPGPSGSSSLPHFGPSSLRR